MKILLILLFSIFSVNSCPPKSEAFPCVCSGMDVVCDGITDIQSFYPAMRSVAGYRKFKKFTLKNSALNFLQSDLFEGTQLTTIELINSTLASLTDADVAFKGLEKTLEKLDIINSLLFSNWEWTVFKNLNKFKYLKIENGDLEAIDKVDSVKPLRIIRFVGHQINFIDDEAFRKCHWLRILYLDRNLISTMKRSMFQDQSSIMEISLKHNNIGSFPSDMFTNMPWLKILDISHNKLLTLKEETFIPIWDTLEVFKANGNSIRCNCLISWILSEQSSIHTMEVSCSEPKNLKGKDFESLTKNDLRC